MDNKDLFNIKTIKDKMVLLGVTDKRKLTKNIIIPDGVQIISSEVFNNTRIQNVILPDSLEFIEKGAFKNCVKLKAVFIPKSVKTIKSEVFLGCKDLKIYCESEPQKDWIDEPEERKEYYDDMTEAFNFHRSSGSFDELHLVKRVEVIYNSYNVEKCPVYKNVSKKEFLKKTKYN